jgi:ABC-type transport system involved in cytochrome c biogenesis permease subunit
VQAQIQSLKAGVRDPERQLKLVAAVPPTEPTAEWTFLLDAEFGMLLDQVGGRPLNPATMSLATLLQSYAVADAKTFNTELTKYQRVLADYETSLDENEAAVQSAGMAPCEILSRDRVDFETFFNHFSPFFYASVLYLVAFLLAALAWLGWSAPLNRAANWLLQFTLLVHTCALVGRIYISGRPPVTNLYSSAVFIGWGCVVIALVIEALYRLGIGNVLASITGFLTLVIAYNLSLDGDTFVVLQAVLDTQFWLATHVVCITLGYATTFLAGMLGVLYLLLHHVTGRLDAHARQQLTRMIYGTLCFAIFFSFVGTVLGGLWADDSWGRFWGWDPKENGALIIVLWNALVLHARWGALVGPKGLANLVVVGNIVTAWSWFGVNELGVGLHAYGANDTQTAMWLLGFVVSQLAIIAIGLLPEDTFRGRRDAVTAAG